MTMNTNSTSAETTIEADPALPIVRITRDFRATPAQIIKAHLDPEIFVRWIGPNNLSTEIEYWDARTGGRYRYWNIEGDERYGFFGSFHEVTDERLVQTFTFDGWPDGVSLDTMRFEDLGNGITRMHSQSLLDSFEARDGMLASGMEVGVTEGYAKLDRLLADGVL